MGKYMVNWLAYSSKYSVEKSLNDEDESRDSPDESLDDKNDED